MRSKLLLATISLLTTATILTFPPVKSQAATTPQKLRVLEVRYFPKGETDLIYHPNTLSSQLQQLIKSASTFHGYNTTGTPAIEPEIIQVINRHTTRPNIDGNWGTTYTQILAQDNLCQKIHDLDIDQIWLWVDPRPGYDPNPGVEYAISSPYFQNGVQFATVATPAFCNGLDSFTIMGFDFSRTADLALHSFGHYLEGLLGNLQTVELFWYRFGGNTNAGYPLNERCGNVHFPPNGTVDYDYANQTTVNTACEDWKPDNTGTKTSYNCTRWGCTQAGYLKWWMQNMPNTGNQLTYQNLRLPSWWDFTVDLDETIKSYYYNNNYSLNRSFIQINQIPPSPSPSPSLAPTPSPTPTPTSPSLALLTRRLPRGRINRSYRARLSATSTNLTSPLNLTLLQAPANLNLINCRNMTTPSRQFLRCNLEGIPTTPGEYTVNFNLTDGLTTIPSSLLLTIRP